MRRKNQFVERGEILRGLFRGFILLLVCLVFLALITSLFYDFVSPYLNFLLILINILILIYIGFYTARRAAQNGWLHGALAGLVFMGIILLIGAFNLSLSYGTIFVLLLLGIVVGGIGGILGVNL